METLDHDYTLHAGSGKADEALAVKFYIAPIRNSFKSEEAGRPIYEDTEMIEIRVRGDRNNVVQRPVREEDKRRFRDQFRAYKDESFVLSEGTPLKEWPSASASMVEELKYLGFQTVEHVAEASDTACGRMPGLLSLKQKAAAYLELAKGGAPLEKMQSELDNVKSENAALQAQLADMNRRITEMQAQGAVQKGEPVTAKKAPVAP